MRRKNRFLGYSPFFIIAIQLSVCALAEYEKPEPKYIPGQVVAATVLRVKDGDTVVTIDGEKNVVNVRFQAIDAPEGQQDFADKSKAFLESLILNKEIELRVDKTDHYGRTVARIFLGETDIEREMIAAGLAWHCLEFNQEDSLAEAQKAAKAEKRGIWAYPDPLPPWEWRAGKRPEKSEFNRFWANSETGVIHNSECEHFGKTRSGFYSTGENNWKDCGKCGGRSPKTDP